jgi:hypothetical protein
MTLGELKIACMKLIEVQQEEITVDNLSEEIRYNVIESINRAMNRVAELGKYPKKSFTLLSTDGEIGDYDTEYTISDFASDFYLLDKITYEDSNGIRSENVVWFFRDDDTLVLPMLEEGKYYVKYTPIPQQFTYDDSDTTTIALSNLIVSKIPYFVKADIFEEEQPAMAINSRNIFENYLATLPVNQDSKPIQKKIKTIFTFKG